MAVLLFKIHVGLVQMLIGKILKQSFYFKKNLKCCSPAFVKRTSSEWIKFITKQLTFKFVLYNKIFK